MEKCYVVSGRTRFQDLGDAIEEAKKILFQKLKIRHIETPTFTIRDIGMSRVIVKATYDDYSNRNNRGSRSVCIRYDKINPSSNSKIEQEYNRFSL